MRRRHPADLEAPLDVSPGESPRNATRRHRGIFNHAPFCLKAMAVLFSILILVGASILCALLVMGWSIPYFSVDVGSERTTRAVGHARPDVYVAAMVRTASDIRPSVLETLVQLSCANSVGVHILAAGGIAEVSRKVQEKQKNFFRESRRTALEIQAELTLLDGSAESGKCAPFEIVEQDDSKIFRNAEGGSAPTNRVDRIAAFRDYQRSLLFPHFMGSPPSLESEVVQDGVVVVIDLDLGAIPSVSSLVSQIDAMLLRKHSHDVVCAAGVTMASQREPWYYDTYATVLLPDTYTHPLKRRLIGDYYEGEDPMLVRSDDQHGKFTQGHLMKWLHNRAKEEEATEGGRGMVRVRSCFGGLALYRTSAWFEPQCRYSDAVLAEELVRYASKADGRPCEHVVFHDCLKERGISDPMSGHRDVDIAIDPRLITLWKKG